MSPMLPTIVRMRRREKDWISDEYNVTSVSAEVVLEVITNEADISALELCCL